MNEDFRKAANSLLDRYSRLQLPQLPKHELENLYANICKGRVTYQDSKKYLDILSQKGELLNFISFLKEAQGLFYKTETKAISYDGVADEHTYMKGGTYGLGGAKYARPGTEEASRINLMIREIENGYKFQIMQEQQRRDNASLAAAERASEARQVIENKYQNFINDLNAWNSKDCYWKSANMKKRPTFDKYGLTEQDLIDCGFYSEEAKNVRKFQYQNAYISYNNANSWIKHMIFGGKMAPSPADFGLVAEDFPEYYMDGNIRGR